MKLKNKKVLLIILAIVVVLSAVSVYLLRFFKVAKKGDFVIFDGKNIAAIYIDSDDSGKTDYKQVIRAAGDLRKDIKAVTGQDSKIVSDHKKLLTQSIIIGTLGKSDLIDSLADSGKIDVSAIRNQWEAYTIQIVDSPIDDIQKALVIAGSDKRGTIYGIYELSEAIGVSPGTGGRCACYTKKTSHSE